MCVLFVVQAMKRVRTEQIQYAVAQYLKRRQYVDTDGSLKGAKLFQSAEEMAASLTGDDDDDGVFSDGVGLGSNRVVFVFPLVSRSSADGVGVCQHRHRGALSVGPSAV